MTEEHQRGRATAYLVAGAIVALLLGTLFFLLTEEVAEGDTTHVDVAVSLWFARRRSPGLTTFFLSMTALGSTTVLATLSVGLVIGLSLARRRGMAVAQALAMVGAGLLSLGIKAAIGRPRPTAVSHLVAAGGYSFPSGHTIGSVVFFVTIALLVARHVRSHGLRVFLVTYALAVALLVALSRIYLGVHYLTDVAGGALVGIVWSIAVVSAEHFWRHARARTPPDRPL